VSRVVVDIGNSRMKWGLVRGRGIVDTLALTGDQLDDWDGAFHGWQRPDMPWAIASVSPAKAQLLSEWLEAKRIPYRSLTNDDVYAALRRVGVTSIVNPRDGIGIDRLLGVLAAWQNGTLKTFPTVVVAVGTAMTIDVVTADGVHRGGVILPGPRLMAESLHRQTAKLPLIEMKSLPTTGAVGIETHAAIRLGIRASINGAVQQIVKSLPDSPTVIATGGDVHWLDGVTIIPTLILDGIRISTEPA
jgi:type III pantothenate kinase